jgi:hypothetical protein
MISGEFYKNDIKGALQMYGAMSVSEIKAKLLLRNIKLDDTQILDALDKMIRTREVRKSDIPGKYVKSHIG